MTYVAFHFVQQQPTRLVVALTYGKGGRVGCAHLLYHFSVGRLAVPPIRESEINKKEAIKMNTVKEIEKAIAMLPQYDFKILREWLDEFEAKKWDEQFENDVKAGKLDKLAEEAVQDYHAKKCKKI